MGLTVSRKTAKHLAVRRKNCQILTISRKKKLTIKFFPVYDLSFSKCQNLRLLCVLSCGVRLRRLHILSWYRKQTFGSGPADSYSANRKCLLFARGLS